ncbi:serine/threonine-protein phosphatase 4 regulatory subunit 2 [Toxorhynchites rutilus septentrionalis]|uniref:serine/threonine-protein phosphatase 4 regulatory subunit 2 n=1 Tax=Toxorhynchites rutilus septentrionalis TaxID=329112 RepID=UPI0024790CC9|nr:serine/threonine-protein phosphatase 4 regulatory subunit 2 [Toxorhynchites rutilus septentrionalis]
MENPEEVLQLLERFTKLKQKEIPRELEDYLGFVARTGDTVYRWAIVKHLFREKLVHVITDFHDNTPSIADLPQCPNVDPFNYERMKRTLLERLEAFNSAPFTVQRICELLTEPRKQYTRIDKFMRAVEKNILVVSTQEPGRRRSESENGDSLDSIVNGDLEVNVDIEMDNEAFNIESNEIGQNTAQPEDVTSAPAGESSAALPTSTETADHEKEIETEKADKEPMTVSEPLVLNNVEVLPTVSEDGPKSEDSATVIAESTDSGESSAIDEASTDFPVQELPKDDPTLLTGTAAAVLDEGDSARHATEHLDEVDSTTKETQESTDNEIGKDLQLSSQESQDTDDFVKMTSLEDKTVSASAADADGDDSVDDGQPQAKLAKLEDPVVGEAESKDIVAPDTSIAVDPEKDEISSGSTTDSGGSSTSVDSESISPNTDSSVSTSAETENVECAQTVESTQIVDQQTVPEESLSTSEQPNESTPQAEPAVDVITEAVVTSSGGVSESGILPVEAGIKQIDVELEPTAGYVVPDEMETVSSTLVPESVMATDEEDTNQSAVDAVVPMSADVPEASKADDNAMDIDESSVEPMDQ